MVNIFKIARVLENRRQNEVAAKARIPVGYLSDFENGKRILSEEQMTRLKNVLSEFEKAKILVE
jgi:transcriptional regulator with XRE-family HTH domain